MKTTKRISGTGIVLRATFCGLALVFLVSCASSPKYPVYPEPTTRVLPASFDEVFRSALTVLKHDDRLELHTIDKAGRFVAWEKTSGFIFFRHRAVFDIGLSREGENATKISMKLSAEDYETGGLTREAGWYPSSRIDAVLGEDIMNLIEQEVAKSQS